MVETKRAGVPRPLRHARPSAFLRGEGNVGLDRRTEPFSQGSGPLVSRRTRPNLLLHALRRDAAGQPVAVAARVERNRIP